MADLRARSGEFLHARLGISRYFLVPSLLWLAPNDGWLVALVLVGLYFSLLLILGVAPRVSLLVCGVCFLSFVAAAQDFASPH